MTTTAPQTGSFPSPYEIATPEGCEGWEEMYPYYALFDERRRESDENRFWFWNSMHFPIPHPAFDVICIDSPYQAVGSWQNRVFAVPPAMGIDYRVVNGYVYISGNPVTDPDKIAERAGYFQKRAGHYFANWAELYDKWKDKMRALIAELDALQVPGLPEYEPDEVAFNADRNTAFYEVLDAYGRCLRLGDLMWQNHFEFLLLGYGAYATFAELCKEHLPDIPDQHIAQMVAGIDVLLFRPDAELRRLAGVAIEKGVDGSFVEGRTPFLNGGAFPPAAAARVGPEEKNIDPGRTIWAMCWSGGVWEMLLAQLREGGVGPVASRSLRSGSATSGRPQPQAAPVGVDLVEGGVAVGVEGGPRRAHTRAAPAPRARRARRWARALVLPLAVELAPVGEVVMAGTLAGEARSAIFSGSVTGLPEM